MPYLLPQLVDDSAERHGDREAIRFSGEGLTWAQFARRCNALAHCLVAQGVRRRDRVGIYLNKSLDTAIAIYGIMKTGAAYVPLDPSAPVGRLATVAIDCGLSHVVTQPGRRSRLGKMAADCGLQCAVGLDPDPEFPLRCVGWDEVDEHPGDAAPDVGTMEQDLAYVMYTSGSTGQPKGIMHTHHSGLSYAYWAAQVYEVGPTSRLTNHAPLHFDLATFDYFAGALGGAATIIVPEEVMRLPASYSQLLEDERITTFFTVPFTLVQLLLRGVLDQRDLGALRWIIFGGEPFPVKHLRAIMQALPATRFSNMYGPAEVNGCTYYHVPPLEEGREEPISIGPICPNMEALVVDGDDQLVPDGEPGELLVRTPTMMRGYWNQPGLNAKAFYRRTAGSDQFEEVFYRTGDLVIRRADGCFDFLGRKDRQVKTRGYRVELDEVEAALASHPEVAEAAAFAVGDGEGSHRIEGAAIGLEGREVEASDLIRHASDRLPWYAVPARVEVMQALPRTTSGKIDRRALREAAEAGD
ncbi:MAG: D-alanine--poly(phosphoribitol) ligase [Phycisphaeraceae bacterium]|nr:D-alanine--poly(phosphoribitol) ligase [Phycisphaeraceae bacterium]